MQGLGRGRGLSGHVAPGLLRAVERVYSSKEVYGCTAEAGEGEGG